MGLLVVLAILGGAALFVAGASKKTSTDDVGPKTDIEAGQIVEKISDELTMITIGGKPPETSGPYALEDTDVVVKIVDPVATPPELDVKLNFEQACAKVGINLANVNESHKDIMKRQFSNNGITGLKRLWESQPTWRAKYSL